ncbi:MAG TPA: cytochrome c oxidase assembly protein [Gemmatimonadaceae bacterium]|jgi:cytochrome c oxidase assembly factor CtaG
MLIAATSSLVAPNGVWRAWSVEPGVVVTLVATAAVYGRAAYVARRHGGHRAAPWTTVSMFATGWIALAVALASPLDPLAETLFVAHMAQHLVLIVVAAPLLVLGAPPVFWLWALPTDARRTVGRAVTHAPRVRWIGQMLSNPPLVLATHIAALWFWHFPRPYQAALEHSGIHILEHASFLGTAMAFWWVVLHPGGRRRLGFGASILYVGIALCQSGALGALLMFSARPWYPVHAAGDALWDLAPLADQQMAGLIMWIPVGVVYVGAAAALFVQWMTADERATRLGERPTTREIPCEAR